MKYNLRYAVAFGVASFSLATPSFGQASAELGPNLVRNSGFDNDVPAWQIPGDVAEIRKETATIRNGIQSLRFVNTDPAVYKTVTQVVPAKVGDVLHFSVWIKGQEITSANPNNGAGIYMEGLDEGGGWVTGSYAASFAGTYDWKQAGSIYRVPAGVAKVVVGLYLRKDSIGTAWFDDVEVRAEVENRPALQAALMYPNYRGLVPLGNKQDWEARLRLSASLYKGATVNVKSTVADATGKLVATHLVDIPVSDEKQKFSVPAPRGLKAGDYTWKLQLADAKGEIHSTQFAVKAVERMPQNHVDAEGFTISNGKRFFPLGLYLHPADDSHLKRIADAGFNTVLSYSYGVEKGADEYLANAQRHGLRVVFSIKDMYEGMPYAPKVADLQAHANEYVTKFRDRPALLAWYINDELEPDYVPKIQRMYAEVKKLDPNHLTYSLLIDPGVSDQYFDSTDAIGSDPYPVVGGDNHLRKTTTYTQLSAGSAGRAKSTWMVLQSFDYAVYGGSNLAHQPTRDEMRNQAYQAIINGAKGILFYSYFDMWYAAGAPGVMDQATFDRRWPAVTEMSKEISALSPAILHGQAFPLVRTEKANVEMSAIHYKNELLLLVANPFFNEVKTTLTLPDGWKVAQAKQGDIEGTVQGGNLTLSLPKIGSGVFRLVGK